MEALSRARIIRCDSYDICVGSGLLSAVAFDLLKKAPANHYVVITDSHIEQLHGETLKQAFSQALSGTKNIHVGHYDGLSWLYPLLDEKLGKWVLTD